MTGWIIGNHSPGYLPDTDEPPYVFESFDEAVSALESDIERAWDSDADWDKELADEKYIGLHTDLHIAVGPSFYGMDGDGRMWWIELVEHEEEQ